MKRNVLVFGLISGLISSIWMLAFITIAPRDFDMDMSMWLGYASMLVANTFIVVGVKNYRDKQQNGLITFGRAFKIGFLIALVASTLYVVSWLIYYYTSGTDFMEYYAEMMNKQLVESGATAEQIRQQAIEMKQFAKFYQNPLFNMLMTYCEILPLGTLVALFTALALKRKPKAV